MNHLMEIWKSLQKTHEMSNYKTSGPGRRCFEFLKIQTMESGFYARAAEGERYVIQGGPPG